MLSRSLSSLFFPTPPTLSRAGVTPLLPCWVHLLLTRAMKMMLLQHSHLLGGSLHTNRGAAANLKRIRQVSAAFAFSFPLFSHFSSSPASSPVSSATAAVATKDHLGEERER